MLCESTNFHSSGSKLSGAVAVPLIPPERLLAVMADGSNPLTDGDMEVKGDRIAASLTQQLPNEVVAGAVNAKNCVDGVLCREVCGAMGLRFSPLNWLSTADQVASTIADCGANVVFFTKEFAQNVALMRANTPAPIVWVCMDGVIEGTLSLSELATEAHP